MKTITAILVLGLLVACGPQSPPPGTGTQDAAAAVDPARGETLSFACQACHSLAAGGPHLIGPNLHGVFGRAAGTAPGFGAYSDALAAADFEWSPELLDRWLEDPGGFLPGTTMAFTGYRSPADRAALIAFLVQATAPEEAAE